MFSNIGRKIQTAGKVFCWIGIICSVISGLEMIMYGVEQMRWDAEAGPLLVLGGVALALLCSLMSWVGSFFVVGFGKLVENSETIAAKSQF